MIEAGLRFHAYKTLNPEKVIRFAIEAGDRNPVHHNKAYAKKSIFRNNRHKVL